MIFTKLNQKPVALDTDTPPPAPELTPAYALYAITSVVALFLTQGIINNGVAKLTTGLASVVIPAAFAIGHSIFAGRVHAARVTAHAQLRATRIALEPSNTTAIPPVQAQPPAPAAPAAVGAVSHTPQPPPPPATGGKP